MATSDYVNVDAYAKPEDKQTPRVDIPVRPSLSSDPGPVREGSITASPPAAPRPTGLGKLSQAPAGLWPASPMVPALPQTPPSFNPAPTPGSLPDLSALAVNQSVRTQNERIIGLLENLVNRFDRLLAQDKILGKAYLDILEFFAQHTKTAAEKELKVAKESPPVQLPLPTWDDVQTAKFHDMLSLINTGKELSFQAFVNTDDESSFYVAFGDYRVVFNHSVVEGRVRRCPRFDQALQTKPTEGNWKDVSIRRIYEIRSGMTGIQRVHPVKGKNRRPVRELFSGDSTVSQILNRLALVEKAVQGLAVFEVTMQYEFGNPVTQLFVGSCPHDSESTVSVVQKIVDSLHGTSSTVFADSGLIVPFAVDGVRCRLAFDCGIRPLPEDLIQTKLSEMLCRDLCLIPIHDNVDVHTPRQIFERLIGVLGPLKTRTYLKSLPADGLASIEKWSGLPLLCKEPVKS